MGFKNTRAVTIGYRTVLHVPSYPVLSHDYEKVIEFNIISYVLIKIQIMIKNVIYLSSKYDKR